jgi:predicted SAM-dependent methyltransferase
LPEPARAIEAQRGVFLHLGCGERHIPGFIHIDIRPFPHLDLVARIEDLSMFPDGSADLIYACHVLEHFGRWRIPDVLREWHRVLRSGGTLRLSVPDFAAICETYSETGDMTLIYGLLHGRQDYPENTHCFSFDFRLLRAYLEEAGFVAVRRYDVRDTVHRDHDDYSQAYVNGRLMSLNVEADKP